MPTILEDIQDDREESLRLLFPTKKCCFCKRIKARKKFDRNRSTKSGLQHYCKICQGLKVAEWKAKIADEKPDTISGPYRCLCRHCKEIFSSETKARQTCDNPLCQQKEKERIKDYQKAYKEGIVGPHTKKRKLVQVKCLKCLSLGVKDPHFMTDDPINNRICPSHKHHTNYSEEDYRGGITVGLM